MNGVSKGFRHWVSGLVAVVLLVGGYLGAYFGMVSRVPPNPYLPIFLSPRPFYGWENPVVYHFFSPAFYLDQRFFRRSYWEGQIQVEVWDF